MFNWMIIVPPPPDRLEAIVFGIALSASQCVDPMALWQVRTILRDIWHTRESDRNLCARQWDRRCRWAFATWPTTRFM